MAAHESAAGRHVHGRLVGSRTSALSLVPDSAAVGGTRTDRQTGRLTGKVRLGLPEGVSAADLSRRVCSSRWVLAIDDSRSMYGSAGDPSGVRYVAGRAIVDLMARCGGGQIAVVHWGSTAPPSMARPLTEVRSGARRLVDALRAPTDLGGTNSAAALRLSADLLGPPVPGEHRAVALITDGYEQVTPELTAAVRALPRDSVDVLLIDHSNYCDAAFERGWRSLDIRSFTRLTVDQPELMTWEITNVLFRALGLTVPPPSLRPLRWSR
jgi:hypothetical protein